MKENCVKSEFSETWLENGIAFQNIAPKIHEIDLAIAKQLVKDRKAVAGDVARPVLVFGNNALNISKEAREYYKSEEPYQNIKAIAMLLDNYITKFIVNFVFMLQNNPVPTECFNDKEKALKWLEKYK